MQDHKVVMPEPDMLDHLVGLLALTFAAFTISYIGFMRQEIRTS